MLAVNITLPYWYWRRESNPKNHGSQPGYLPLANASKIWCQWGELNTRPAGYEPDALAAELHWQIGGGGRDRTYDGGSKAAALPLGYAPIDLSAECAHKTQTPAETHTASRKAKA